jgi:ribonuclease BN (tRNA processing enzyme)
MYPRRAQAATSAGPSVLQEADTRDTKGEFEGQWTDILLAEMQFRSHLAKIARKSHCKIKEYGTKEK